MTKQRAGAGRRVRHYSSESSEWFWDRVNKLPRQQGGETAYLLGCALQDLEQRVMGYLESAERIQRPVERLPQKGGSK